MHVFWDDRLYQFVFGIYLICFFGIYVENHRNWLCAPRRQETVAARYSARRGVKPSPRATLRAAASNLRRALLYAPRRQDVELAKSARYAVWDLGLCHLGQSSVLGSCALIQNICF
jgi:hypothetical protein